MRSRSLNYMPGLDGLRAIAVLMVFVHHALPYAWFPGAIGVDIFFVISGFLITRILLREVGRTGKIDLWSFYLRRLLRLYPALILTVLGVLAYYTVLARGLPAERVVYGVVALAYVSNIFMTVTGDFMVPLGHTWSLALEEQFYLMWPALLLAIRHLNVARATVVGALGLAAATSMVGWLATADAYPYHPLTRFGALLIGCVVAYAVADRPWCSRPLGYIGLVVAVSGMAAGGAGVIDDNWIMPIVVLSVPFVLLLAAFGDGWLVRLLSTRPLVYLGVVSYGFYLFHQPVLIVLHSRGIDGWLGAIFGLACSLLITVMSFKFVETPALRLKDRIAERPAACDGIRAASRR